MSVTIEQTPQPEQITAPVELSAALGQAALEMDHPQELRPIEIAGQSYSTNLPEGVNPFFDHGDQRKLTKNELSFNALDELEDGNYFVAADPDNTQEGIEPYTRTISIHTNEHGKVIDSESLIKFDLLRMDPSTARFFTKLGYEFADDTIVDGRLTPTAVPTPETIKSAAAALGLDIELFEEGIIEPIDYLTSIADGKFPISGASESYYQHDASATHLKVMLLGGEEIKTLLGDAAQRALSTGGDAIGAATGAIDKFTDALAAIYNELGYSHGHAIERGIELGISEESTLGLIAVIRSRAKEQGIMPIPKPQTQSMPQLPGS